MSDAPLWDNVTLLASETVVNAHMNRERGLSGVNSYDRELKQSVHEYLFERAQKAGAACWYDACCGEGNALREAAERYEFWPWGEKVTLYGADLLGAFAPHRFSRLRLEVADVVNYVPPTPPDLCTCVHGVHYLGDKLRFLENVYAHLAPGGVFWGHIDPNELQLPPGVTWKSLLQSARKQGVVATFRGNLLRFHKKTASLAFGLRYVGAFPSPTPNFSGMRGVVSVYEPAT